jgi:hypothetical protein
MVRYGNIQQFPTFETVQPGLGKSDPTGPEAHVSCGQHQICRSQGAVFRYPGIAGIGGDYDKSRRMVKEVRARIAE